MTGRVLKALRGSLAWPLGLVSSMRRVRCCDCRLERDEALVELARLRADIPAYVSVDREGERGKGDPDGMVCT